MADLTFGWEKLEAVAADPRFRDIIEQQWRELSHLDTLPQPDLARGFALEEAGAYRLWIGRDGDDLAAFIQWQLLPPLGYRGMLWAFDCGHYLDPARRDMASAIRMWREAEAALKRLGVSVIRGHDNEKRPLAPFFKRLGYAPVSTSYQKVIG